MKKLLPIIFIAFFFCLESRAQFAKWTDSELILNNGVVERTIALPSSRGNFITTSYKPLEGKFSYFTSNNLDFQFEFGGEKYSGKSDWKLLNIEAAKDSLEGNGAVVSLQSGDGKLQVAIKFLLYPNLPVIRKSLIVTNLGIDESALEAVDVERFSVTSYQPSTFSWIYSDYGRRRSIGPYEGNMQDALLIVHNMDWEAGILIGNEATGVLKRTSVFWESPEISAGLTHKNARFPFRKWIKPQESFETPQVFSMVYNNQREPHDILNLTVPDFVRKHMGIRLSELEEKPTFVYNTWNPFKKDINEKLIMELADAAAAAGMKEFVIDDGWQNNYGDWGIDKTKFPNGLKPVFDYIKSLGMKPGLWISVGSAAPDSKVYHEHPEWFVKGKDGEFSNLHVEDDNSEIRSACFSTGWKDYIKDILLELSLDYGLEYLKLDFAVVTSAYVFNPEISGCYATDHDHHGDHHESMYTNYERMWELFDELHAAKPDLFIDCTFEAMGGLQLIDFAMLKHAEGNWMSNFEGTNGEKTDMRVRNMAWWRSPAMPATALVIGNPQMQDKGWEMHIKSIAGALPIMLGDPRQLNLEDLKKYRAYADWLQAMEEKHGFMSYRQDLYGFGEPMEGQWDGFQRINTETKSGGIVGVFRHGSVDSKRRILVKYLDPTAVYQILTHDGKPIADMTGNDLATKGFEIELLKEYEGELLEIIKI
ncbi:alpha-galactosidase [Algoriphagus aestuariicola]|uniref:Alpha-galactosidase n=1 Tax=Algoriphagus aestuariicola TaxID=1852016 RepID=A0ABS3BM31_9BACT|nr:glycoside hydrolase family 36 protein [Algoriphagus aestuariicola]MBN7800077.1 alpha-galactosidase [Algoriphagus aestuariicola]